MHPLHVQEKALPPLNVAFKEDNGKKDVANTKTALEKVYMLFGKYVFLKKVYLFSYI